jgi:diguanylate cyclase (GGDEF)-like protein
VAAACRAQLRTGVDLCGRIGGEEFAILLPQTPIEGARVVAERMRKAVAALAFAGGDGRFGITASIGVACAAEADALFDPVLGRADAALYAAKHGGRNRVCTA